MATYRVTTPFVCFVSVEVEAESAEEAAALVEDDPPYVTNYGGNGGWDKLLGVDGSNESIEIGEPLIGLESFDVTVEEVE